MKKLIIVSSMLFCVALNAQTFVSTEPSQKNVILEEYTGINCMYCPDGHRISNQLMQNNPGRLWAINIHQGSFAQGTPDYRTDFGDALANQTNLTGYPSGTVNRHYFSSSMALGRDKWGSSATTILSQNSYVNIAAKSVIDADLRLLTVNVEVYYTANATVPTNNINVALLQNNILGPQAGMDYNPDQIVGDQYNHTHMLRHLLTGQWGDVITQTTQGSFVSKTYTYSIPESLRNVEVVLLDLEVIVFIAEGNSEIITGAKSDMKIVNGKPVMKAFKEFETYSCSDQIVPFATVYNFTDTDINSLQFKYKVDDGTENTYIWNNKTIDPLATDTVFFSAIPITSGVEHTITATLTAYNNGENIAGATPLELKVKKTIVEATGNQFIFVLATDRFASQNSFKFFDANGNVILQDGPWTNLPYNGITLRQYLFEPPASGCYKLEVYDKNGNGINSGNGIGYITFSDIDDSLIFENDGKFGYQANYHINISKNNSIINNLLEEKVSVYPNPANNELRITNCDLRIDNVEIFDVYGRNVGTKFPSVIPNAARNHEHYGPQADGVVFDISHLSSGIYFIKIYADNKSIVKKFIKN